MANSEQDSSAHSSETAKARTSSIQSTNPGRRKHLKALVALGGAAYAGALVVPAGAVLGPSKGNAAGRERWIRVGRLSDVKPGEPKRVVVIADEKDGYTITRDQLLGSLWLTRKGDEVKAMSAVCPHLGCSIDINADKQSYFCPCHVSKFSLTGDAVSGPSPRGMDALDVRVVDGFVEVDFRRYRQGISTKEEVG